MSTSLISIKHQKAEETEDIRHGLWSLLLRTRQIMYKARQKELHKWGISARDSGVLRAILRLGEMASPRTISRQAFLEPHTISEQLKRMEKDGLIRRFKDSKRKNILHVELTEKGYELHHKSSKRKSTVTIISALTHEEQLELWRLLSKLRVRAMEYVGMEEKELYPSLEPEDVL